ELDRAAPGLFDAVDESRIGALGHSSGGLVAVEASAFDPRVRVCANLDGGLATPTKEPLAAFVTTGVVKPTLFLRSHPLYSDADLAKRGLTREQWEARGAGGKAALDAFLAKAQAPLVVLQVAGTGHMTFSDAPFVMPETISRFGGTILDA